MDIEKIIQICNRENISPNYLVALYLFAVNPARNKVGRKTDREKAYAYLDQELLNPNDLENVGLMEWSEESDDWEVIPKIQKWFYDEVSDYAKELWELYPAKLKVGDNEFKAKNLSLANFSKRFNARGMSEKNQKLVIDVTKWAIDNEKLKVGMIKFLDLEEWKFLYDEMMSHKDKPKKSSNITIL